MKIRTVSQLCQSIQDDLAYRRKELLVHVAHVQKTSGGDKQAALRGAVAVLYAHWEGFVKKSLQAYVEFVGQQKFKVGELTDPFVAMAAKKHLHQLGEAKRAQPQIDCVAWFRDNWDKRAQLPSRDIITAESNLSVEVLRDLIQKVGLEYRDEFKVAEKAVIERLVALRNHLAHGDWERIEEKEWEEQLRPKIENLLSLLSDQVQTAAQLGACKRTP